jgi:hypothetical protein
MNFFKKLLSIIFINIIFFNLTISRDEFNALNSSIKFINNATGLQVNLTSLNNLNKYVLLIVYLNDIDTCITMAPIYERIYSYYHNKHVECIRMYSNTNNLFSILCNYASNVNYLTTIVPEKLPALYVFKNQTLVKKQLEGLHSYDEIINYVNSCFG